MYLIENDGNKICVDDIEIEWENNIYKRKIVQKNVPALPVPISMNLPIIHSSNTDSNNQFMT
jgi:hypothetical protein